MGEVTTRVHVATEARIDQQLAFEVRVVAQGVGDGGGEVAACAVTDENDWPFGEKYFRHGKRILIGGGVAVFGAEAVIGGDDGEARAVADFGADVVMAV